MDLLEQYRKEHPEAFRPRETQPELGEHEYGFLIKFVVRLPGGVSVARARTILLGAGGVFLVAGAVIFLLYGGDQRPQPTEADLRRTPPLVQ